MVAWAGGLILARSSKQTNAALSTCEAEVAAAATSFVCVEGLIALLEEWEIVLKPPILLVDNKSALTILELGGSWRTRYFAVRAARVAAEYAQGRIQLRYCRTNDMGADGLTKLAAGHVFEQLRNIMNGILPAVAGPDQCFRAEEHAVSAAVLVSRAALDRRPGDSSAHPGNGGPTDRLIDRPPASRTDVGESEHEEHRETSTSHPLTPSPPTNSQKRRQD